MSYLKYIQIAKCNGIRFVQLGGYYSTKYNYPDMDATWFKLATQNWQNNKGYAQKVQMNDLLQFQFHSPIIGDSGLTNVQLLDCKGRSLKSWLSSYDQNIAGNTAEVTKVTAANTYTYSIPTLYTAHFKLSMQEVSGLAEGLYYLLFTGTDIDDVTKTVQCISEPLHVKNSWPGTILFEYFNSTNAHHTAFIQTDALMSFRCEGWLTNFVPFFQDTNYESDNESITQVNSFPYNKWTLNISGKSGAPDWVFDKVNRALSCDYCRIDGNHFTRDTGGQWAMTPFPLTNVQSGTLIIRKVTNSDTFNAISIDPLLIYPSSLSIGLIRSVKLTDIFGNTTTIFTGSQQITGFNWDPFIASLNITVAKLGMYGYFYLSGNALYYQNAVNEYYITNASVYYTKSTTLTYSGVLAGNSVGLNVFGTAPYSIDWWDGTITDYASGIRFVSRTYVGAHSSITTLIYHNDSYYRLETVDGHYSALGGTVSATMSSYSAINATSYTTADLSPFGPVVSLMNAITVRSCAVTTVTSMQQAWALLKFIDFTNNNLSSTQVDQIFIKLLAGIAGIIGYPTGGSIQTQGQSPAAPPTSASASARAALTTIGFTITTD